MVHFSKSLLSSALLITLLCSAVIELHAYPGGVSGYTRKSGTAGCSCHGSSYYNTTVLVQISGPDTVITGQTYNYTVRVSGGPSTKAGVDIASSIGALTPVSSYLKLMNGELTQTSSTNYVSGGVDFNFKYTAPATAGNQTLYATGSSKKYWNFATDKPLVVRTESSTLQSSFPINAGWNLVSVPLLAANMAASTIFPNANSSLYAFNNGYQSVTTLTNGSGYWARFPASQNITVSGTAVTPKTITVNAGWNLIGDLHTSVAISALSTTPAGIINSQFYTYNNGYSNPTILEPGKGYWVRVSQSGTINIP
ncbi:MAG: hypothetical protein HY965_06210 [Ignavibacteriales bacterium]|nr:hypothetical protein [Ignavibacteriales bacterium]